MIKDLKERVFSEWEVKFLGVDEGNVPIRLTHTPTRGRLRVKRTVPHGRSRPQRPAIPAITS